MCIDYLQLLGIPGGGGIRLPDGHIFYVDASVADRPETCVRLIIKIFGYILRGWIQHLERLNVIEHLVIKAVNYALHDFLQVLEIQQQTGLVQFRAAQSDPDLVVVAVRVLTLAPVIPQIMSGCKCVFYRDFVHPLPCCLKCYGPNLYCKWCERVCSIDGLKQRFSSGLEGV